MQNNKLLPCPFCGGEAIKVAFTWACIADESTIECTICGARTTVLKTEEAIKRWNTRKLTERIMETLQSELKLADEEKYRCIKEDSLQFDSAKGYAMGISNALDIVRKDSIDNMIN